MNLSLKQYRNIDLTIMLVMLVFAEALTAYAARVWFPEEVYALSPALAVVCIVMMRWNAWAALHALAGGIALCAASGASLTQYAVYCIGSCGALAALFLFKIWGKEKIRSRTGLTFLFTLTSFVGEQLGRWLVSLAFGGTVGDLVKLTATDSLSLLFAAVTVQLARKLDGLFEDQIAYLKRTEAERRRAQVPDLGDTDCSEDTGLF